MGHPKPTNLSAIALIMLCILMNSAYAQTNQIQKNRDAKTIGVLIGGSLIGFDYEIRTSDKFGIQIGGGLVGYALAFNYHPQPTKKGSYLSLNYKDMGFGALRLAGVEYCYRWYFARTWGLSFQIGIGGVLEYSDKYEEELLKDSNIDKVPDAMLTYGLGITF